MSKPSHILLTHPVTARANWYGETALAALREAGEVILNDAEKIFTPEQLIAAAKGCKVIVLDRQTPVGAREFAALPDLLAVVRSGVDIRYIDVAAASEAGVLVTRTPAGYVDSTAELVLGHIINAARRIPDYVTGYREGHVPGPLQGVELAGKTVGLIGYGRIARRLTEILHVMNMRVLAHDPFTTVTAPAVAAELDSVVEQSDFLVPLLIASDDTRGLISAQRIARMKHGAFLVNCSRGDVIDEVALVAALDSGRLAGVAMDVGCAPDNMPTPELAARRDVIATPHIGNLTREAQSRQPLNTVAQTRAVLSGSMPDHAINPDCDLRLRRLAKA
ncbi:NAD(P)-dependent oxidoreductase [Hoeflea ulvae]|uniref:Hydroxyacid dehydrogenase n=1 Tax=Hoeflea ulvae TaxID=2983764 RepID=A0ABT3YC19_9HYPH|nr:NAD(P)-dependent oxidoreductase [Hoeflea ulvae]MCY0093427.1 hydroxyacid dehydrogenase [Hoeflea ulvae]